MPDAPSEILGPHESVVVKMARALGCRQEAPKTGLCVSCPFRLECPVPRIPFFVWTARIILEKARAEVVPYMNDLAVSPVQDEDGKFFPRRVLKHTGLLTQRQTAVEVRCGDVLADPYGGREPPGPTENLPLLLRSYRGDVTPPCRAYLPMDWRQLKSNQVSVYGKRGVVAVQACSQEHATEMADLINRNVALTLDLLRRLRPLQAIGKTGP